MMKRFLTRAVGLAILACGSSVALAFSLLGPLKTWQVADLGYDQQGDIGGPMTLMEGYRWNVPTLVYAFDQSFVAYFGPEGMDAVKRAVTMINKLPKASQIQDDGTHLYIKGKRVPFDTKRVNFQAQALGLLDVTSVTLSVLVEQLGLTEPEPHIWNLRSRNTETIGNVTLTNYVVINLNYDPVTLFPTPYVNGVLYNYRIAEPLQPGDYADAIEVPVDPLSFPFNSVAGGGSYLSVGEFYTGLTHDDVGGLRFLLTRRNFANETVVPGVERGTQNSFSSSPWIPFTTLTNLLGNTNFNLPTLPGGPGLPGTPGQTNAPGTGTGTNVIDYVDVAVRPGIEKVKFKRGYFDSLIGQLFITVTNQWEDQFVTNGLPETQALQRVVPQPDFLFTSEDLGLVDNLIPVRAGRSSTTNWINNDAINGVAGHGGPGVIAPPIVIAFSDQVPYFLNTTPFVEGGTATSGSGLWGSFDATTNPPVIYPQFLSITLRDLQRSSVGGN